VIHSNERIIGMPDKKPPHGIGILMIHAMPLKKKKRKAGGNVEGAEARQHLGKRARGGVPHRAPGGYTDDAGEARRPMAGRVNPEPLWTGPNFGQVTNTPVGSKFRGPDASVMSKPENRGVTQTDLPPPYAASNPQAASRSGPPLGGDNPQAANRSAAPFREAPQPQQKPVQTARRAAPPPAASKNEPSADGLMAYWNARPDGGPSRWEAKKAADEGQAMASANQLVQSGLYRRGGAADKRARGGGIHIKPSHAGRLHEDLGVPSGEKIPAAKLDKALHSADPAERKRAVFAKNAKSWSR